jgi:hypothetical protein
VSLTASSMCWAGCALDDFIAANPRTFAGCGDPDYPDYAFRALENWINAHPEKSYLVSSCTDEVAIGQEGTPLRFDIALSSRSYSPIRCDSAKRICHKRLLVSNKG